MSDKRIIVLGILPVQNSFVRFEREIFANIVTISTHAVSFVTRTHKEMDE